jgi:acetyl esterase/lipase
MSTAGQALVAGLLVTSSAPAAELMQWKDLLARPRPQATLRVPYGREPLQFAELWLPAGPGPHPVVLMVHGGCWTTEVAERDLMNYIAEDLRARGIAVWNLEYRGVDRPGGGYPGTFLDVARGADALRLAARAHGLTLDRVVGLGHSAGGHLVLWLAARSRIPPTSPLHSPAPLTLAAAIAVGSLSDLEAAQTPPGDTCGVAPVRALTGAPTAGRPDVYRDTSPAALLPFAVPQILVNSTRDRIAPPAFAAAYAARALTAGVVVRRVTVPDEGHAELVAPGTASWRAELELIEEALGRARPPP